MQLKEHQKYNNYCQRRFHSEDHWTQDAKIGGGRIIGEACHLLIFHGLIENIITSNITYAGNPSISNSVNDQASMTLKFSDGSVATIHYLSNGHKSYPKERFRFLCQGKF